MSNLPSNRPVQFTPPSTPPEIAKSDLPSNRQVRFTLKSSVRFTPPKSPSPIYPQIAKSDLPSNRLYDLPPQNCQVRFTSNHLYDLPPQNRQVRFTLKSPSLIYPQIVCMISQTCWNWGGSKSYRRFEGKLDLTISGGVNRTDDLRASRTWHFGGGKSSNIFHQVNTFHLLS